MRTLAAALAVLLTVPASAIQVEKVRVLRPASSGGGTAELEVVSGEILVRFDPAMGGAARESALARVGGRLLAELPGTSWTQVALPEGMSSSAGLLIMQSVPGVREVQYNGAYRPTVVPNDPSFSQQYHLGKVNAAAAWEYEKGSSNKVTIAVMDAGMQGDHPELQPKVIAGSRDCTVGPCVANHPPTPACNHGTQVAGVAAAVTNNGAGVAGVSWGAQLVSIKVFPDSGCTSSCNDVSGVNQCVTSDAIMARAIDYARATLLADVNVGRLVLNMSLGQANAACPVGAGSLQEAIDNAFGAGIVLVVSAGNSGATANPGVNKPANCANVIPVAATDANDNVASFSSRGPELAANGVAAPGQSITTTDINSGYSFGSNGTSFSAPIVSGLASLILAAKPTFTATQVKDTIRSGTESIGVAAVSANGAVPSGSSTGAGRVNAFRSMKLAVDGTLAGFAGDQKVIAFPNPFRTGQSGLVTITIPTSLQSKGTSIRVYTMDGRLVRDLKSQTTWDGKNDGGLEVASGTYLVLVKTDAGTQTGKVAVIR